MKRDNINYVLVGVIVLAALAALLFTLAVITGRGGASASYYVTFNNVAGLRFGAPVYYEGYRVGQISGIEPLRGPEGTRYRVELGIRSDWPIPSDSVAAREASGLLADVAIGISEGSSPTPLEPGGTLTGQEGGDVFSAVNELAGELTSLSRDRIRPIVESLATRAESLATTLDEGAPELVIQANELLTKMNIAAENLNSVLDEPNRQAIAGTLKDVRAVAQELKTTQQRADTLLASLNDTVEENRPGLRQSVEDLERTIGAVAERIDAMTHHLESSSRNFDEFSREIRRNPQRLLFTQPDDEVEK